jgi:uncharacterized damage-inducible protein DinB
MYLTVQDFIADWKAEVLSTIKIFESIPDAKKSLKGGEHLRTLERLAWHITQTLTEMPSKAQIVEKDELEYQPIPHTFAEIIEAYKNYSGRLIDRIENSWRDADLVEKVKVYGEDWERRKVLSVLVLHQAHHRGQMTALMRMLGLKVPGIYGPSREEWSNFGMPAME